MISTVNPVQVHSPAQLAPKPRPEPNPIEILQKTISASRLNCWLQCRLKFFFRYVQEIRKPPTPSLHVGSVVHLVLKAWNMARWRKQAFELARFKTMFDVSWADQQAKIKWDGEDEPSQKNMAWSLLETYFTQTPIKANEMPEAVEVPVEAELSRYGLPKLIGIMDLVRAGGRIVDFKTAAKTPSAEDAIHQNEVQLSCYSVLYREAAGKRESARELHYLVKTKKPKVILTELQPMSDLQQVRLFRMIDSYQEGLAREDFVPSPGIQCAGCEFRNECRRWC
jgi:CRISPR/Cas system-associated exonuclease Cas4 (RecB family)